MPALMSHHNGGRGHATWILHLGSNSILVLRFRIVSSSLDDSEGECQRMGAKRESKREQERARARAIANWDITWWLQFDGTRNHQVYFEKDYYETRTLFQKSRGF